MNVRKMKFLSILLTAALIVTLLPLHLSGVKAADSHSFSFVNEQYSVGAARITTSDRVTLTGTINAISTASVKYSVFNINPSNEAVITSNENQTGNIVFNGSTITVFNIQLFPGMNRITFSGSQGASTVSESIYIEYRNSPMLYDLSANLNGSNFALSETQSTVVYSTASMGRTNADVSISGKAPNATKVTVSVDGKSNTYSIANADASFVASPINLKKGMNLITIRVFNNTQYVETTREVAFYNGDVTFYDMTLVAEKNLNAGSGDTDFDDPGERLTTSLTASTNFSIPDDANVKVTGKVIVPIVYDAGTRDFTPNPGWIWDTVTSAYVADTAGLLSGANHSVKVIADGAAPISVGTTVNPSPTAPGVNDKFVTVDISHNLGVSGTDFTDLKFNDQHSLRFTGWNQTKIPVPDINESNTYFYKLRNSTLGFIQDVNYLPGYNSSTNLETSESSDMENASLFTLPAMAEVLIGNFSPTWVGSNAVPANLLQLVNINTPSGDYANGDPAGGAGSSSPYSYQVLPQSYVKVVSVNGVDTPFLRVFVRLDKLPNAGSMKLRFQLNSTDYGALVAPDPYADVPITLLYGPFAKYDKVFDGMQIEYDTTMTQASGISTLVNNVLGGFKGQLFNIANISDIRYEATSSSPPLPQSAFLYVNNTEIPLELDGTRNKFKIKADSGANELKAFNALNKTGDNAIKFVFRTTKNNYESIIKVTIIPTNLPVIPAPNTDGIYPYTSTLALPLANDPNFPRQGPLYTTTEAQMKIYGTFDFLDLGVSQAEVNNRLDALGAQAENYMLIISSPDMANELVWNMGQHRFYSNTGEDLGEATLPSADLRVVYDYDSQTFAFYLNNQFLPADGSSRVYGISVYNGGLNGPRATFRLEVDPTAIPYTLLSPRSENRTVNQDFVEVILTSPGAESVQSGKVIFEKITYLDYSKPTPAGLPTEIPAFRAIIPNLKARDNKITLTIRSANDTSTHNFTVTYAPETIPGAQELRVLGTSLKAFGDALALTFPSGINLIRRDYNVPDALKGQVYKGNNILFAVANPEDGVVDRHDFETLPSGYDLQKEMGRILFTASFPQRFIKASPVFWIDGGQADDPTSSGTFDPILTGSDPLPFSVVKNETVGLYYNRSPNRELIPSKNGTLTLKYDKNMRQAAGTMITVFRFDPFIQQWENIGGVVDVGKNTIKVPFTKFGYYVVGKVGYSFNDVTSHPYAMEAIEAIYAKGIMNATDPSGAFGTDSYVTRGEFARMLVKALEMPLNYDGPTHFVDVPNTGSAINIDALWDYRYIETAARAGIVRGTLPRVFEPDASITRQDASVMLTKALNLKTDTDVTKVRSALEKAFRDEASIDFYAKPSVAAIYKKGFILGSRVDAGDPSRGFVFEPKSRLLRSDAAMIVSRVMTDLKKLPKLYG